MALIIISAIILAIAIQCVNGNQRIVEVSKPFNDEGSFNYDEGSASLSCCIYGTCSCNSLDYALTHLSSNVLINITTDVTLSSVVSVISLENISVIGYHSPTVNCTYGGGIHFTLCCNCIIQGIIWDGCGTNRRRHSSHTKAVLNLSSSSNTTIQNCCFQNSIGQSVVLSTMSGYINISNCQFVFNSRYNRGQGAAIHYSSNNVTNHLQLLLTISYCNFSYNRDAKSLVYIENRYSKHNNNITIQYSKFYHNQGVTSIYVKNQKLTLNGNILFQNNTAKNGAGLYISDYSTLTFGKNSNVVFIQNSTYNGGAVFLTNHSVASFDQNSIFTFNNNYTINGTIYSITSSNVTFAGSCKASFSGNLAKQYGAAIFSLGNSHVIFTGNSAVIFSNNFVHQYYKKIDLECIPVYDGIIFSQKYGHISFEGNSSTVFNNNRADCGGAIYSHKNGHISFKGDSSTAFINNRALVGGVIYANNISQAFIGGNSSTVFDNNYAYVGGVIYSYHDFHISFNENSSTVFSNNYAESVGGAIRCLHSKYIYNTITNFSFEGSSYTAFKNNSVEGHNSIGGGALYLAGNINLTFKDKASTVFYNNRGRRGGAIFFGGNVISFEEKSFTVFNDNTAASSGGAIYLGFNDVHISFKDVSSTVFNNNSASLGGALLCDGIYNIYILFEGKSSTVFNSNNAGNGGAVYSIACPIYVKENSYTMFSNTVADFDGGAIHFYKGHVSFSDSSSTVFSSNIATGGGAIYSVDNRFAKISPDLSTKFNSHNYIFSIKLLYKV